MIFEGWAQALAMSLESVWSAFETYLPNVIGALVVFIIGLIVSSGLASLVERALAMLKIDMWLARLGVGEYVERAGMRLNVGHFLGQVVYWFITLAFVLAAADILGLNEFSSFLRVEVLGIFLPRVIAAALIMLAALVLANFLKNLIAASVMSSGLHGAHFLSVLAWWSVVVFGFFGMLIQLGIAQEIVLTLVTGIIAMLALAGGIAFGLGGKDLASHLLKKMYEEVQGKK